MGGGFKVLGKDLISSSNFLIMFIQFLNLFTIQLVQKYILIIFLVSSLREEREIIGF